MRAFMKKNYIFLPIILIFLSFTLYNISLKSEHTFDTLEEAIFTNSERRELSECIANLFWANLSNYYPYYDFDIILEKLKELSKNHTKFENPRDCQLNSFLSLVSKIKTYDTAKNLKIAETFFGNLKKKENIIEIIKDKLYFERLQEGTPPFVEINDSPSLDYKESTINQTLHETPRSIKKNITITLSDTIQGFAQGIVGMGIGERRKIFVHPDLAYGKVGGPQELIIFEVEIISK